MSKFLRLALGIGLVGAVTAAAVAQTPVAASSTPPRDAAAMEDDLPFMLGWMRSHQPDPGMMPFQPPPRPKGAVFHLQRGEVQIVGKCDEGESMKACVEAAGQL